MRLSILFLTSALVLGSAASGNALAHGSGYGRYYDDDRRHHEYYRHKHRHGRPHRKYGHWKRHHRYDRYDHWRPRYYDDSWYGIHLFFGGH
jgi:hypothetical protein